MERATGEDDPCRGDRHHLCSIAAVRAVCERGAAVHHHRLAAAQERAVSHEEVRLHPAVASRRYRNRRRVPTDPGSKPDDRRIALRGRRCQADLHRDPFDQITERLRPAASEERDRALRAVVNGDENGETPSGIQPVCSPPGPDEPSPHKPLLGPLSTPLPATNGRFTAWAPAPQPLTSVSPTSAVARTAGRFSFFAIDTYTSPLAAS